MTSQTYVPPLPLAPFTELDLFATRPKDPINLVYAGGLADLATVLKLTEEVLDCTEYLLVGDQVFAEPELPAVRHRQDINRASSVWSARGRYHTRIYQVFATHPLLGRLIASPIHVDAWAWCGFPKVNDVAITFDGARDEAAKLLEAAGYDSVLLPLGRPDQIRQCNGTDTPTDGQVAVVADRGFLASVGLYGVAGPGS